MDPLFRCDRVADRFTKDESTVRYAPLVPPDNFKNRLAAGAKRAGLSDASLSHLTSGESSSEEIVEVMDAFFLSIQPEAFEDWIATPVPALEGFSPGHLIRVGRAQVVRDQLVRLADGHPT